MKKQCCNGLLFIMMFTMAPYAHATQTNVCLNDNVIVTVPSGREEVGKTPDQIVDGDYSTQWGSGSSSPVWAVVDLTQDYAVDSINIIGVNSGVSRWRNYTVYYDLFTSLDQSNWSLVGSGILYDNPDWVMRSDSYDLDDIQARYIKFQSTGGSHWPGFNELEVFSTIPEPATMLMLGLGGLNLLLQKRR